MKFKGTFTDRGARTLEKGAPRRRRAAARPARPARAGARRPPSRAAADGERTAPAARARNGARPPMPCPAGPGAAFLPTLEKFGKTCQLLITPDQFCLVQTSLNTDGAHVCARVNTVGRPGDKRGRAGRAPAARQPEAPGGRRQWVQRPWGGAAGGGPRGVTP
jgi:hypothetical protein